MQIYWSLRKQLVRAIAVELVMQTLDAMQISEIWNGAGLAKDDPDGMYR